MSKYRFKTKKEFIRDGLWNDEYNCPDEWASEGQMNKYLGIAVPDEFNIHCDENEDFQYDGWYFQNTDYVLKEQQKYFDDLSQHIGRYIIALVDNPNSGSGVKKGDVGKIISDCRADFPNRKAYSCTLALSKNYLGVNYELLPEDYSSEPENTITKDGIDLKGRYIKVLKDDSITHYPCIKGDYILFNRLEGDMQCWGNLRERSNYFGIDVHLNSCFELMPKGFVLPEQETISEKKESNVEFVPGKWYKLIDCENAYRKCSKIPVEDRLPYSELIGKNGYRCETGSSGDLTRIKLVEDLSEIQDFLPNSHPDKITSDVFKKGEYIVIIKTIESYSKDFTSNYIYKQKEDYKYLRSELDNYGSITNGWETIGKKDSHTWRYATQEEIDEYERRGKPYDVTELQKKELSMEQIQEECKKRFPIGCTYISTDKITNILKDDSYTYCIIRQTIWGHSGGGYLYENGKWAELVSLPEENITEIPEYVKCNHYFGNEYIGKIYDTSIDKPEKMSSNTWHEILITCGRLEDGSFEISNKEAYEKQKSHIPEYIECTETREYYFIKGNIYKVIDSNNLSSANLVSNIDFSDLKAGTSLLCSIEINGKKYWKPSTKEKYDQQKSWLGTPEEITTKLVIENDPYEGATINIFNSDEVGQYLSTAFDYWKNVPTFVEKEFDIYGPTPDIE